MKITPEQALRMWEATNADPAWWISTTFDLTLAELQRETCRSVQHNRVTLAKTCNATGKTLVAAAIAHWWGASNTDRMVITTATSATQSKQSMWREMEKLAEKARRAGRDTGAKVLTTEARWPKLRSVAFARTVAKSRSDDVAATMFHGTRAANGTLIIIDEATGIPPGIFTGAFSILTGAKDRLLVLCNPTDPATEVARMFKQDNGYAKITFDAFKSPNIQPFGVTLEDIISGEYVRKVPPIDHTPFPYLTNAYWVRDAWERFTDHGLRPTDPRWVSRVLAQFPEEGDDILIPMTWIRAAFDLYRANKPNDEEPEYGVDVADGGDDSSVITERRGCRARIAKRIHGQRASETTNAIVTLLGGRKNLAAKIDSIGVGAEVFGALKALGYNAHQVDVSKRDFVISDGDAANQGFTVEKFANARSQFMWALRKRFYNSYMLNGPDKACDGPHIELEPDETTATQLNAYKWKQNAMGQIEVEKKDETKRRLGGKSPDEADSLMIAFAPTKRKPFFL